MFSTNIQARTQKLFVPKGKTITVCLPPDDTLQTFTYQVEPHLIPATAKVVSMQEEEASGTES